MKALEGTKKGREIVLLPFLRISLFLRKWKSRWRLSWKFRLNRIPQIEHWYLMSSYSCCIDV